MQNKCNNNSELIYHVLLNSHLNSNLYFNVYIKKNYAERLEKEEGNTSSTGSALTFMQNINMFNCILCFLFVLVESWFKDGIFWKGIVTENIMIF